MKYILITMSMMKKNKYIIVLLLLSNLFTGCEIGVLDN